MTETTIINWKCRNYGWTTRIIKNKSISSDTKQTNFLHNLREDKTRKMIREILKEITLNIYNFAVWKFRMPFFHFYMSDALVFNHFLHFHLFEVVRSGLFSEKFSS